MTKFNQAGELEDPFTSPRAVPQPPAQPTVPRRTREQDEMTALNQTYSSRLNAARPKSSTALNPKTSSRIADHPAVQSSVGQWSNNSSQPNSNQSTGHGAPLPVVRQRAAANPLTHVPSAYGSFRAPNSPTPANMLSQQQGTFRSVMVPMPTVHQPPPVQPAPAQLHQSFTVFPKLPVELQQEIWSISIATEYYNDKRLLRVAPDSESLQKTRDEAAGASLRIISDIHRRARLIPSMLHACQYTRKRALKGYELWGCVDPSTYEENNSRCYVKVDIDTFFFGDADLAHFWVFNTLIIESERETEVADDIARNHFVDQTARIRHFAFDYELWTQMLEYEAMWLANLDLAEEITVAVRNPNHEDLSKDHALCFMKPIVPHTFRHEIEQVVRNMSLASLHASLQDLNGLMWPITGNLNLNIQSLSMGTSTGNSPEDETYLEDVLIEGNRAGVVSDAYLQFRLGIMHQPPAAPPIAATAPAPAPAPAPAQNN